MIRIGLGLLVASTLLSGCTMSSGDVSPGKSSGAGQQPGVSAGVPSSTPSYGAPPSEDPYIALADDMHRRGVEIWFETDLVKAWLGGKTSFDETINRLKELAKVKGVVGFKIADELGYGDGLQSQDQADQFLRASRQALDRVAPGAELLVDVLVTQLGCLPWRGGEFAACAQSEGTKHPAVTIDAMNYYLSSGLIDRLDLSTGLLRQTMYQSMGTTQLEAQREAWSHVRDAHWGSLTHLQARKALAGPGGYAATSAQAADAVTTYVDVPVGAGAEAVDIWAWRQVYEGEAVSILPPDMSPNSLWKGLEQKKQDGVRLFTHMRSSTMPVQRAAYARECDMAASLFDAVFVAAGTG